ncbi:TetR/AcrR family transcriptional regulator [Gordonia sp. ABSL1-1]|uniref:TetR/AcrR family transcriptional regulator n=1 Tax=Gordonia sp. ABSL1-1 TaxID=3053923 RepID=UPI002573C599|nr:TetR/AcrR family transcriptional regulator [Gordonia sp. ABSL1-1]MDL9938446.1 TetR/AcrR family transcriptional regulator [Gordonia sp. ABSL1-1]
MTEVGAEGRRYGGAAPDERRERRRRALIDAGLDVFGAQGYPKTSVKGICERAGLTQRYFYESFADRAALLVAVYDDCVDFVRTATVTAAADYLGDAAPGGIAAADAPAAARAALGAFMSCLADDPRRARVMLVEVVGVSPEIERVRMKAIHSWAELILLIARGPDENIDAPQRLAAVGLVGAVTQLLVDWFISRESADAVLFPMEQILDVSVDLFVAAYGRLIG